MLEEHVAYYLEKYLGNYVKGLSKEALKISAWQGNVELTNMQLKPEALNALKLPIKVKAGFLGSVKLKVPWSKLGKEPVIVLLDRIFVLAEPQTNVEYSGNDASIQEAKKRKIKEAELAMLDAKFLQTDKAEVNNSWLGSLISTIIGNLKLSITNIHIRYEDSESNPGHPFAIGLTLKKLAAVTVDEDGKETFISSGPLDRIQKAGELQGLALYLDPDTQSWDPEKPWEKLSPTEWSKMFEPGIEVQSGNNSISNGTSTPKCHYLLQPVGASARYTKLGSGDARTAEKEIQRAVLRLHDVTLSFSQAQYRDGLKLAENFSTFKKRLQYTHYRPTSTVKDDRKAWWKYAYRVTVEQLKKASGRLSWEQIVRFTRLRKKYLSLYINCLQSNPILTTCDENKQIQELDRELDVDVAVQWRMLAHSYVDKSRKDENNRKQQSRGGWWSFLWGNQSSDNSNEPRSLTEEDWKQLNQVIGYQEGNESSPGQDPPDMLHTVLEVHMQHNATKLVDENCGNIIELSAEELQCNAKFYKEMKLFDFELGSYQLSSPEGLLAESEAQQKAIGGEFIYMPLNKSVDWSLSAKASPCYITYFKSSIDEVVNFFQNSDAVSQAVARETAAALQATLDEVARSAQQQLNEALKQKPRFSLYLDIAAPKIIIPSEFFPDGKQQSKLLLDLGYLTLQTEELSATETQEEIELYMRFKLGLTDVQIFLVDGEFDWREHYDVSSGNPGKLKFHDSSSYLPVLERCGITLALQQICGPHPGYPATRLAVRLPSLGFHFSPARYHRLMHILKVFQSSSSDEAENSIRPWDPADFEGEVSVLGWKGVGNREAVWQRRYAALAGPFLYILDSPSSSSFRRRTSFFGKQVLLVPPESIGGVLNVVVLYDAGQFNSKVAESVNTLLLRFDSEESREIWQGRLQGAIYRSSAPAAISGIFLSPNEHDSDKKDEPVESHENAIPNAAEKENFFLTGALDELKIVISSGPTGGKKSIEHILLAMENPLLELRALGSKVEFVMREFDMSIGAVLQALEIEDKYSGRGISERRYLASSDLDLSQNFKGGDNIDRQQDEKAPKIGKKMPKDGKGKKETFFDTEEDLGETENGDEQLVQSRHYSRSSSVFYDAEDFEQAGLLSGKDPPKFERIPFLLPDIKDPRKEEWPKDKIQENFVKAQVILFSLDSPAYKNVDKQITVSLATLSFFCIRPTIMALLNFTDAITADVTAGKEASSSDKDEVVMSGDSATVNDSGESKLSFDRKDSVIKGLLGSGKERTLFLLELNMRQAVITLNTENGGQIANLANEDLSCKIKVFPSSFAVSASLGNLRISDSTVDREHPYSFICNTRNPGSTSFIELEFSSFNKDDDDYEGYEYSLVGKLSEIRFVYLNRFIQEISAYFMGLAPRNPGYIVKIDNKVTDVEKFFTQSEVEGSPAIKLDVSLTKPILLMPRETNSRDFLELDVLHIKVTNSLKWIGGEHDNPGAVRLDTTVLHVEDIHLSVGMNGKPGEGIIKKANGLSLIVTRSLRDLWHQVPGVDASIKIEELKADLSDKEYQVITECALSNLAEKANLPPPVLLPDSDGNEEHRERKNEPDLYVTESKTQERRDTPTNENANAGSWTTIIVTAEIDLVELSLFKGTAREQALATAQVSGMWVAYKVNSIQESYIMASLKSLSVKDDREGTEPVLQYMIGKADDMEYHVENKSSSKATVCGSFGHIDCCSPLTMLVMDAKLSSTIQMISLRIQQPKLLVAVDFLLAIAEFFVPSLHTMVSDLKDTDEDPLNFKDGLYLDQPVFRQQGKENAFSPKRPLVVDNFSIDDYVYDGQGGSIRLQNENGTDLDGLPGEPLIFIGSGKHLRFKNVVIQSGDFLHSCIFLGVNSSYTILEADGVFLRSLSDISTDESIHSDGETDDKRTLQTKESLVKELMFDLQAIGPELTFYDSMSGHMMPQVAEKLIRAKMDVFSRFVLKGGDMELNAKINGLSVEASSGLNVVEPVDAEVKYSSVSGKQDVHITLSDILTNFSFSVLQLVLRLQEDISSFLRITTKQTTVQCYQFDKIWTDKASSIEQQITFWRPRVPPGFAVLGDCVTPLDEPLAKGVLALNMSLAWFKRPTSFEKVWSSGQSDSSTGCSAWMPIPPPGYVAFGCVVTEGMEPPPLTSVVCIMERVATSSSLKDCIIVPGLKIDNANARGAFWRVDNSVGSFFVAHGIKESTKPKPFELLHVTMSQGFPKVQDTNPYMVHGIPTSGDVVDEEYTANNTGQAQSNTSGPLVNGHLCETVAGFKLVWWNKNDNATGRISIWRPILPPGCAFVGDLAVEGYEPPSVGLVLRNQHDDVLLKKPLYFEETGHIRKHRALNEVFFWLPVAPPGYAALGCIATESDDLDSDLVSSFRCIRNDLVVLAQYGSKLWDNAKTRHTNEVLSIWSVDNKIGTFITRKGLKAPPRKLAFCLADLEKDCEPDNLVVDAELKTVSAVIYDDFRGLMIPLLNLSLSGVNASSHGRMDALCSTLNFSLTALTYNGKCSAWEPLIEQFDGAVRHNYKSTSSHVASRTSTQLRVVSNSTVNINVSVTNLNMLLEAYASWNTLSKLMEISKPDATALKARGEQKKPALEFRRKKSFQVIHHNKLGEDLLIRCIDINGQPKIVPLPSGCSTSIHFPTSSSILDPSLKGNIKRSSVKSVKILLGYAELLHDGGFREQKYMATVRIFPQLQTLDRRQLDEQSARTRGVSPMTVSDSGYSLVRWDEVFACEMETEESSTTEIMVTELATGSTVGYCSFPLSADNDRPSSNAEKKGDSRPVCAFDMKWEPLRLPQGCKQGKEHDGSCGKICYGVYAFPTANEEGTKHSETGVTSGLRPGRIQVSYKTKECWRDIGLNYAVGATCWHLGQDTIATETILDDANRQLTFRSLVVVMNAVDFPLEVALSVKSTGAKVSSSDRGDLDRNSFKNSIVDGNKDSPMTKHLNVLDDSESPHQSLCTTDEVFENERYQPLLGWGSTWPGHFLPADPRHWSRHDYSCSVQEFPEALLPLGWEWIDDWKVDKVGAADEDGWSYAFDFKKDWPPVNNSKASTKFVRRRRWIRSRKCMDMSDTTPLTIGTLKPQESTSLPVASLRSNSPDYSLQFRPHETNGDGHSVFRWSDAVLCKGHTEPRWKRQSLPEVSLQSLMEAEELLCSSKEEGSSSEQAKSLWFVVDVKARERGINSQLDPLRDWQIAVVAPLILYNYLPVSSEYTVLEKCSGSGFVLREKGVIEPGQEAHLYDADIRQALYLTWIPQGGWQPEDVPVLISHPFKQAARHISLKNFSTGRLLHVLVDHCSDGKDSVAKRIRFYVPCWLDVKKVPPLHCSFVDLQDRNKSQVCLEPKASSHIKVLETIQPEEMDGPYTMVSNFNLGKMGVSAALAAETEKPCFQTPTRLHPLSQADGYVELRALDETRLSYYKILASTKLCPFQSIPTKVLLLRPYITFTNRLGEAIYMKQTSADEPKTLEPSDWRVTFPLPATEEPESLQVRLGDTHWSLPFIITKEETLHISMRKASSQHHIMVEVRGYEEGSRFLVVFRQGCSYGPYRLENRMRDTELQYRQSGLSDEAWQVLQPCSSNLYVWENPHGEQLLEVLLVKNSISTSEFYAINRTGNHYPCEKGLSISFYCEVLEIGNVKVVKFHESNSRRLQTEHLEEEGSPAGESSVSRPAGAYKLLSVDTDGSSSSAQMEVQLELGRFGISFIDLKLREILYLCMEKVSFTYATGYAGKARRIKLLLGYLQLDNQLPLTILPVVLVPEEKHDLIDPVLKISVIISDQKSEATEVYPYIGVRVTKSAWRINIHEPIIWAIMDFYNDLHLDKISGGSDVGQVDPEVRIDLIDISETRLKLTLETGPRQRPRGLLGMWSPIVSALGNTSKMPIHLRSVIRKNRYIRKSAIAPAIVDRLRRDLIHNPLMLLSGVDVLGMTSSTLATLSETVAELSSDGKFLQLRSKLDRSRRIGGVSDGLVQGTEAIAQGVAFGLSGVIRRPMEKAKEKGFLGFFQGLGKAALGIVMEPMSGVIDFVSLTVNGVGASCTRCFELFEQKPSFDRIRLPRFIQPNGVLCCYYEKAAMGQFILQLAEGRGRFHQGIFFREPSKFAWSDFYEDHFDIINHKIVMITNKRVMLLQRPKSHHSATVPLEPSFIMWDVPWAQLLALEAACSANDQAPIYAVLHLRNLPTTFAHLIKCSSRNSEDGLTQAKTVLGSISKSWKAYGPARGTILQQMGTKRQHRISSIPSTSKWPVQFGSAVIERAESQSDSLHGSSSQSSAAAIQGQQKEDMMEIFNFVQIWTSEQVAGVPFCVDMVSSKDNVITIWQPIVPEGYVSIGDIAHIGKHPPLVSISYWNKDKLFTHPTGFDLVWRSWKEGFVDPVSIWMPRAPDGYTALGCVTMAAFLEPEVDDVWCAHSSLVEDANFEEQEIWHAPNNSAWGCFLYQVASEALTFMAVRQAQQKTHIKPKKVVYR